MNLSKQILGSSLSLPAYERAGQTQHLFFWRRISQSEIRNSAAAEKSESESEGGQKLVPCRDTGFLPPNPLPFCPLERSVWRAKRGRERKHWLAAHGAARQAEVRNPLRF